MSRLYRTVIFLLLIFAHTVYGQAASSSANATTTPPITSTPANASTPQIIRVGAHLLGIDQLDLYKGTYAMDLYLVFFCQSACPELNLEVINGTIGSITEEKSTPSMKIFRIKALIEDNFHSKNYPFDNYWLRIIVKDKILDINQIKFEVEPSLLFIDQQVILHGWQFRNNIQAQTTVYTHPILHSSFSEYTFMFNIKRPTLAGWLKVIFPSVIMILFAFLSFIINPDKIINRFGIVSGALLGSVLFHINLTSNLPPLGYLTFVDSYMLINYLVLFMMLFENVYVMRIEDQHKTHKAVLVDKVSVIILPFFWLLAQAYNAYYFLSLS